MNRLVERSGFRGGGGFSGESRPFCVLSGRKWDFLHVFWAKVDLFAWFFGEGGLFRLLTVFRGHVPWEN